MIFQTTLSRVTVSKASKARNDINLHNIEFNGVAFSMIVLFYKSE